MWVEEAENSKIIAPECDECGNNGRFLIHQEENEWIVEPID